MILAGLEWISISWCVRGKDNNFALRYFEHFDHWQWRQSAIETINVDQRVGRLVPPADKRLLKQTVNPPSPPSPSSIPPFLPLLEPSVVQPSGSLAPKAKMHPLHWSGACILFCTANCTALNKYASCIVQNYTAAAQCNSSAGSVHKSTAWLHPNLIALAKWTLQRHWLGSKLWGTQCNILGGSRLHCAL